MEPRNSSMLVIVALLLYLITPQSIAQQKYDTTEVRALTAKAYSFLNTYPDSLLFYAKLALQKAEEINDDVGIAEATMRIGAYYYSKSNFKEALEYYKEAEPIINRINKHPLQARNFNNIGLVYTKLGDHLKAAEFYHKALRISEPRNNKRSSAISYLNLGLSYQTGKNEKEAIESYQKASQIFKEINEYSGLALCYNNLGLIYTDLSVWKDALNYYSRAVILYDSLQSFRGLGLVHSNIAIVYLRTKEFDKAISASERAIDIGKQYGFIEPQIVGWNTLAEVAREKKEFEKSISYGTDALTLALSINDISKILGIYESLSKTYSLAGRYKEATVLYEKHLHLNDSIFKAENLEKINNLKISYEVEKKEAQIAALQKDKEIEKLNRNITIIVACGTITLLVIIIIALRIRQVKDRRINEQQRALQESTRKRMQLELENKQIREHELKLELESKQRELTSYTLHLIQKNELLNELKSDLKNLRDRFTINSKPKIASLVNRIQVAHDIDREWENFKTYFEGVHLGFFDNLKMTNPDLSTSDLKLCALLRMNLENKQIAAILDMAPDSVKTARHRLKRKLNVDRDEDLSAFLASALN